VVLGVVISFIFMFFLRCFAGCFIWVSLLSIFLIFLGLCYLFLWNGGAIGSSSYIGNLGISVPNLPSFQYYNIFGWICLGLAVMTLLVIICCCGRIRLAVALCSVAGEFVSNKCQVMLVPIVMTAALLVFWVFAIFAMVTLIGTASFVVKGTDIFTGIQDFTSASLGYFYYFVFGSLWTNALLQAITIFVIASACAVWYFSKAPGMGELDSPVCSGFWMAFRYHLGSLAFGSFILALVQFIQFIFEILNRQMEAAGAGANACYGCIVNCIRCFLACVQRIIEFINKNAYIQIAITGRNFCGASGDAVALIASNPLRYGVVAIVGWILALVGKLLITALTVFLFYLFITFVASVKENIQEPILMLVLVGVITFAIAVIFMSVFEVSVDTLLVCFLIDEQVNTKPQFAHPDLAPLLDS
jgi:solute carrier family 44 (choline transporter-like protein), member 2/4/5